MRDLNFQNSGCEPSRGPRALLVAARRGVRSLLRPMFVRLVEILENLVARLDRAEARFEAREAKLDAAERLTDVLFKRTDGLADHLAGLNGEHLALRDEVRSLQAGSVRVDAAEKRLDEAEWNVAVLHQRTEGLTNHLSALSGEHGGLNAEFHSRVVQLSALSQAISSLGRRQTEILEKVEAVHALHWDHVALARRLAVIEDLLSSRPADDDKGVQPSVPFPRVEGEDDARSLVG